jgi:HEAT repeat protein
MRLPWCAGFGVFVAFHVPGASAAEPVSVTPSVRELIRQLETGDVLARQDAADALGRLGPAAEEAVPTLTAALKRECLRRPAALALAAIGPKGWQPLLAALADSDNPITPVAREALGRHAPYCLHFDVSLLRYEEQSQILDVVCRHVNSTRQRMVKSLVPADDLTPLLKQLKDDDWWVRKTAAEAIGRIGPPARRAIPALLESLEDPWPFEFKPYESTASDKSVRVAATKALLAIGPAGEEALIRDGIERLTAGLERGTPFSQHHCAVALALLGPRALPALDALVEQLPSQNDHIIYTYGSGPFVNALIAIGPNVVPAICRLLGSEKESTRSLALEVLEGLGHKARRAAPAVRVLIAHPRGFDRYQAVRTLACVDPDGKETISALCDALKDEDESLRSDAAAILGLLGPRASAAISALQARLKDPNDSVAREAARAIVRIRGREAEIVRPVAKALVERGLDFKSCSLLAGLGPEGRVAIPFLLRQLREKNVEDRLNAAEILLRFGDEEKKIVTTALARTLKEDGDLDRLRRAKSLLLEAGPQAAKSVTELVEFLEKRGNDGEIASALQELHELGRQAVAAAPAVRRLLENETEYALAAVTLARIAPDDPAVVPALMALLKYPYALQRDDAACELFRLGPAATAAVPRLEEALREPDDQLIGGQVRLAAAAALIRITGNDEPYSRVFLRAQKKHPWLVHPEVLGKLAMDRPWALEALADLLINPPEFGFPEEPLRAVQFAGPAGRRLIPDLIRVLRREMAGLGSSALYDQSPGWHAVSLLRSYGPDAKAAIPVLRELLLRVNSYDTDHLEAALRRIEGDRPR